MIKEIIEAVICTSTEEAREVLEHIEKNTEFEWGSGRKPTKFIPQLDPGEIITLNIYPFNKRMYYATYTDRESAELSKRDYESRGYDFTIYKSPAEYIALNSTLEIEADNLADFLKGDIKC